MSGEIGVVGSVVGGRWSVVRTCLHSVPLLPYNDEIEETVKCAPTTDYRLPTTNPPLLPTPILLTFPIIKSIFNPIDFMSSNFIMKSNSS